MQAETLHFSYWTTPTNVLFILSPRLVPKVGNHGKFPCGGSGCRLYRGFDAERPESLFATRVAVDRGDDVPRCQRLVSRRPKRGAVWLRLSVHIIAASGVVLGGGLALSTVAIPLVGAVELGWFAPLVAILFLVWMADLFNFMDGMDGFAGLALCRRLRKSEALVRGGAVGDQAKLLSSETPISGGLEWTALHDRSTEDAASVKCIVEFS